jgi:maltooligosyltrehalose trehalohydrolase
VPSCPRRNFSTTGTEWGDAFNFDGPGSIGANTCAPARYWIEEFHLDGLRLDATQSIHDTTSPHIISEIARVRAPRDCGARGSSVRTSPRTQRFPDRSLPAMAEWTRSGTTIFHHSAMVALTGRREAYTPTMRGRRRSSCRRPGTGFIRVSGYCGSGSRATAARVRPVVLRRVPAESRSGRQLARREALHQVASAGSYRAMTARVDARPWAPMLFQGQELCGFVAVLLLRRPSCRSGARRARRPARVPRAVPEFNGDAAKLVRTDDEQTFLRCKIDHGERRLHARAGAAPTFNALRRTDAAFHDNGWFGVDGAVLGPATSC